MANRLKQFQNILSENFQKINFYQKIITQKQIASSGI